ncbi:hypothetical protein, partial [uncultured Sphingomonas sp.]
VSCAIAPIGAISATAATPHNRLLRIVNVPLESPGSAAFGEPCRCCAPAAGILRFGYSSESIHAR